MFQKNKYKRGKLTLSEINNIKLNIKKQLDNLKRCALIHDNFIFAFSEAKKRIERCGGHLNEMDFQEYLNPLNRGKKNNDFYVQAREKLSKLERPFVEAYNQKFSSISNEFQKRGLYGILSNYMSRKGAIYTSDLDVNGLSELTQFISLYDQLMSSLSTMKINLNYIITYGN